jgi:beta-catenin-like protein 1
MVQTIDVILAWLIAEDDGAKKKVVALLADRDEDLSLVRGTLQGKFDLCSMVSTLTGIEQLDGLGEEEQGQKDFKDMLSTLLQFL